MPPHVGLNCTVSSWRTSCLLVKIMAASSWIYWPPPRGDLGCLLVGILVASSLPPCGEPLSPRGELHFSAGFRRCDRISCVFLFPRKLVRTLLLSSARRFCHLLYFSLCTNFSWWFQHYGRTFFPTLRSDFVIHKSLLLRFFLFLRALPYYKLHRSTSLLSFANVTVGLLLYHIL